MENNVSGIVYLVGAGPGDPELLTLKAQRLISECDALVHDALVPREVVDSVSTTCEVFFVGKRSGCRNIPQSKTNKVLVDLAKQGKKVVRLKGGDPFVFGRGGEEAMFLQKSGIRVEIVPGVTSGVAAPSYLGIPLTHRLAASTVTFVTGHEDIRKTQSSVNWRLLAKSSDTIVIYMGIKNFPSIVNELILGGMNPKISSAVIQQATVKNQRCIKAPLNEMVGLIKRDQIISPSIIIIGSVVDYQVETCRPIPSEASMPF
tara:strand:+ start:12675 stop:13454 length:780 start_codon:yes stop_codon:yes gene_type:complete